MRKLSLLLVVGAISVLTACSSSEVKLKDTAMTQMIEGYNPIYKPEVYDFVTWDSESVSDMHEFLGSDLVFLRDDDSMMGFMFFKTEDDLEKFMIQLPKYVAQTSAKGFTGGETPDWHGIYDNAGKYAGVSAMTDRGNDWYYFNLFTFDIYDFGDDNPLAADGYIDTGCIMRLTTEYRPVTSIYTYLGMDFEGTYLYPAVEDMWEFAEPYISGYVRDGKSVNYMTHYPDTRELKIKCVWKDGKFTLYYDER